jgi:hypothetical protein
MGASRIHRKACQGSAPAPRQRQGAKAKGTRAAQAALLPTSPADHTRLTLTAATCATVANAARNAGRPRKRKPQSAIACYRAITHCGTQWRVKRQQGSGLFLCVETRQGERLRALLLPGLDNALRHCQALAGHKLQWKFAPSPH